MSENPVRSASEEVAAEFVCKGQAYAATRRRLANLIESKFAPVVAATEEAMKEKIRRAVKKELGFIIHQEKVRVSGKYTEKFAAKDITPEEVSSYCSPTSIAWENAQTILEVAIRAIPTGTALAEYVGKATAELRADEQKALRAFYSLFGRLAITMVCEVSLAECLDAGIADIDRLHSEIATLKAQLAEAEPIIQTYARENPKRWNPKAEKGMTQSVPQDPMGAHAWLEKHAALSAPAKESEKQ